MATLEDLARVLGGVVRVTDDLHWLDTKIGELRAAVIRRSNLFDLAVFTPDTLEPDPFLTDAADVRRIDGPDLVIPRLRHGYEFSGCRGGVLFARSMSTPSLEHIVATLWDLAHWARKPWRAYSDDDYDLLPSNERSRFSRYLSRLGFVAIVVLLAALVLRCGRERNEAQCMLEEPECSS
jgi:hypothetical protein